MYYGSAQSKSEELGSLGACSPPIPLLRCSAWFAKTPFVAIRVVASAQQAWPSWPEFHPSFAALSYIRALRLVLYM